MVGVLATIDGQVQLIASVGVPYSATGIKLRSRPEAAAFAANPVIVEDASNHPILGKYSQASKHNPMSYYASVPIEFPLLPFQVTLICVDPRSGTKRPENLLRSLITMGEIFRDELELIGDLALQAERAESNINTALRVVMDSINSNDWPCALVDCEMTFFAASPAMRRILDLDNGSLRNKNVAATIPHRYGFILEFVRDLIKRKSNIKKIRFPSASTQSNYTITAHQFILDHVHKQYFLLDLHIEPAVRGAQNHVNSPTDKFEDISVTSEFLIASLVKQRRLLQRGKTSYHAISRWRQSIKEPQISALRALKRRPPSNFVDSIARDLAGSATALFGSSTFAVVSSVPCGHSGTGCLAQQLGIRTAEILGLSYQPAFEDMAVTGSSHPITNAKRPRMRLKDGIDRPVLLIDDVATSGSHIDEAARLLKTTAPAVLPLVWIAG